MILPQILLLAAILAGLLTSRQTVRLYFKAQLLSTLVGFVAYRLLGSHHPYYYALVYAAVTLPILECICFLIWEEQLDLRLYLASINFGVLMGIVAAIGIGHHPVEDYVTFCEGVMMAILGMALRMASDKLPLRTIGTLCLALSCYDFAYLRNDDWAALNSWLPAALCSVAFWYIALKGNAERIDSWTKLSSR